MRFINELQYLLSVDLYSVSIVLEALLVTACISTIIFLLTKKQYVSYLSSAPIFYVISWIGHGYTHFILVVLSMTIQAGIILFMSSRSRKLLLNTPRRLNEDLKLEETNG